MASSYSSTLSAFKLTLLAILCVIGLGSAQLNSTYYISSCPNVLSIIRGAVSTAVSNEARMGASLLRPHFHDCFVQGCDASVLLDGGEKNAPPNANSIRGFEVIDTIKTQLENACARTVSCADILAVAARDADVALGGPTWTVQLGRRDSTTAASTATVLSNIPSFVSDLSSLNGNFSNKGFTTREMIALSGAHTIGQARCTTFRNRIYNENTTIDSSFATTRQANCPTSSGGDNNLAPLDSTPNVFDNRYFTDLVNRRGLLHSDQQLFLTGGSTNSIVTTYSTNGRAFRTDFANAMIKMGNLSPLSGTAGQVRTNCRRAN